MRHSLNEVPKQKSETLLRHNHQTVCQELPGPAILNDVMKLQLRHFRSLQAGSECITKTHFKMRKKMLIKNKNDKSTLLSLRDPCSR